MNIRRRTIAAAAAALIALGTLTGCAAANPVDKDATTNCTVNDKTAARKDATTEYRVYTSCGVFSVSDDPFLGQWNSADTYGSIQVGKTYNLEAYGWRNGFFSIFPNIKKATEVTQ